MSLNPNTKSQWKNDFFHTCNYSKISLSCGCFYKKAYMLCFVLFTFLSWKIIKTTVLLSF